MAGCATGIPVPREGTHDVRSFLEGPSRAPAALESVDTAPAIVWRTKGIRGSLGWPAVGERVTIITTIDKFVYALDTRTGQPLWRHRAPTTIGVGAVMGHGRVFVGTEGPDGTVRALALTNGRLRWRERVGDVAAPIAYRDSTIYVSTHAGSLIAFRADNGRRRWEIPRAPSLSGPLVHGGNVMLVTLTDTLLVVDAESGVLKGRAELGTSTSESLALLDDSTIAIAAGTGELLAVSIPEGVVRWRAPIGGEPAGPPVVHADTIHVITNTCMLRSFPRNDPVSFRTDSIGCLTEAAPLLVRDGVVVATVDGRLLYYRRSDRRVVWSRNLGSELRQPPMLQDGLLIAAPSRGPVVALR